MKLEDLGYSKDFEDYRLENSLGDFDVARVIAEHKDRYIVQSEETQYEAELIGNLRYTAESRSDLPVVGDWVAISEYDVGKALVHAVLPRFSAIERQAVGKSSEKQIIAANIDVGLIVLAVNRDFSINRVERYLTICNSAKVKPVLILNKTDLISPEEVTSLLEAIEERMPEVIRIAISLKDGIGLEVISDLVQAGKTYCLLGSSGVGKSSLLNELKGENKMSVGEISESVDRGKHVTSHRELVVLDTGGIIIDNPGMREVGVTESAEGLELTFDEIYGLSEECKYNDCKHINENGCAVLAAVESGAIDSHSYDNFQKMVRERAHFESSIEERRSKDKDFGKMIRTVMKHKKKNKF